MAIVWNKQACRNNSPSKFCQSKKMGFKVLINKSKNLKGKMHFSVKI